MLRFAAGAGAALLLILAGFFYWQSLAQRDSGVPAPSPQQVAEAESDDDGEGPAPPPSADSRTKEQRRFDRSDKDKNGRITLAELHQPRRRAFAWLDTNGDGRLSFEEWAVRTTTRFNEADRNRDASFRARNMRPPRRVAARRAGPSAATAEAR
jgi:hypothetical protein